MREFLQKRVLDNSIETWLFALCFVIGGFIAGKICSLIIAALISINGNVCQITFTFFVAHGADYVDTLNRVNMGILSRFEEAGIALA
jgi:hypothetical protein